jgi:GGDEF domain-containing protein
MAERLCDAIAAIPFEITASVGTSSAPLAVGPVTPVMQLIDDLIDSSDTAMYQAKRAGGNQVCHSGVTPPLA